jgi:hypothetical protein
VFKFFNFGERFIGLMNSIGTDRTACFLWEDGTYSTQFSLKSGRAQGDGPSPLQYNFAEQILLFRLELDAGIRPAFTNAVEAGRLPAPLPWFEPEINKSTSKVEALADDTTVIIKCCEQSLLNLKTCLENFGNISGLVCNIDKTNIMPVGGINELPFENTTGFLVTNKIKLLGMEIDDKLDCLINVHQKTVEKITNITEFWSRFWLSLPGRINIVKTLCLSQINYIGCIIPPTTDQLRTINQILENFVKSKLSISRERMYGSISQGGLGLIDVSSFIKAQHVLWIKRTIGNASDNWREDIYNMTYGNPLILHPSLVNPRTNPIIYNIAVSFIDFKKVFFGQNDNYKKSHLLMNPLVTGNRNERRLLDLAFFRQIPLLDPVRIANVRFNNIYRNGPLAVAAINDNNNLGIQLNFLTYLRLSGACGAFVNGLKVNRKNTGTSLDLGDFFKSFKKGSAGIRKMLTQSLYKAITFDQLPTTKTFIRLILGDGAHVPEGRLRLGALLWGDVALPNHFRDFLYKFYNNCLGINTRISHFVPDRGRGCTFCSITRVGNVPVPDESFLHLFYDCDHTARIRNTFMNKYFNNFILDDASLKLFWFGIMPERIPVDCVTIISILFMQYGIWRAKLKNKVPSYPKVEGDALFNLATACKIRQTLLNDINNVFSRNIRARIQHGGLH